MKIVILAGGLPSTINDENDRVPKPMVQIGERPLLWHIMKLYSYYGYNDFIICTGYRADLVKQYFLDYYIYGSDITVNLKSNDVIIHNNITEPWKVTVVDTGLETTTAQRILKIKEYVSDDDFIVTYGDCITDLDINKLIDTHKDSNKDLTVMLARPTGRNTIMPISADGDLLCENDDNYIKNSAWVNGCTMIANSNVFNYIDKVNDRLEIETIKKMSKDGKVNTYRHNGFWVPVETMRDKLFLQNIWDSRKVPWKIWE